VVSNALSPQYCRRPQSGARPGVVRPRAKCQGADITYLHLARAFAYAKAFAYLAVIPDGMAG
jgi:hypothetical protein